MATTSSKWLLCEECQYSWLHDHTRPIPGWCPECHAPRPIVIEMFGSLSPRER